uniref:Alcohol dehydrogenase 1A (class I), alpha polypeptide n=1 Tax=Xenopus tropicalis TaxID=8364 RepID=A0A6I8PVR9_XENTR
MDTTGKVIKCKAAIAWGLHKPLTIEEIEVAPPKAHEVRIKILASGICGSDLSVLKDKLSGVKFPTILGHEAIGIVESIGKDVTVVKPGDKAIPLFVPQCGQCRACKTPNCNVCEKNDFTTKKGLMQDNTSRFTCKGEQVYHFMSTSTFTEYTVVPDICVAKVDPAAPVEGCLIGCGFATGYGAAVNTAKVTPGSTCAVFGLGGVGFSALIGCKIAGAGRIIGVGSHKDKFPKAIELGATECLSPKDYDKPIQEVIRDMTNGGVDFAFECSGNIETMKTAFESTYIGSGVTVLLGVAGPNDKLCFHPGEVMMGRTIKGLPYGGFKGRDDIPKLIGDYMANKFNLNFMVSERMPLEKINEAFELMASGKGLRNLIIF